MRVAPVASVKSDRASIALTVKSPGATATSSGHSSSSGCRTCAGSPGPMSITWALFMETSVHQVRQLVTQVRMRSSSIASTAASLRAATLWMRLVRRP